MVHVNWKTTATFALTGATALVGWIAAPPAGRPARATGRPPARTAVPAGSLGVRTVELERARPGRSSAAPRNLFRYQERTIPRPVAPAQPIPTPEPSEETAPLPLRVSGIARDVDASGRDTFTAVLSGPAGVALARTGDLVGDYEVVAVDDASVRLLDRRTAREHTIRLAGQ